MPGFTEWFWKIRKCKDKSDGNILKCSFSGSYNIDIDVIFLFVSNGPCVTHNHSSKRLSLKNQLLNLQDYLCEKKVHICVILNKYHL